MSRVILAGVAIVASVYLIGFGERGERKKVAETELSIDPNTAPTQVLSTLPRIGPSLAGVIVKEREKRPFRSLDDLDDRVRGIGPATRGAIGPYLRFEGKDATPP